MAFSGIPSVIGFPQIQLNGQNAELTPLREQGFLLSAVDPYWGGGEFVYARASAAIRAFGLCVLLPVFDSALGKLRYDAVEVANTANLGQALCVSQQALTTGQYSWFMIAGCTPVNGTATVTAGTTVGITGAGQIGANSAGKQLIGVRSALAATTTVVKAGCVANNAVTQLAVPNTDGWFVGAFLSGTGIAATTTITQIDPSGRFVTLSLATNAAISGGSITATYNNATIFYNVVHMNRPYAQGAIT